MKYNELTIQRDINNKFYCWNYSDDVDRVAGKPRVMIWGFRNHLYYPKKWGKEKGLKYFKEEIKKKILAEIKERQEFLKEIEEVSL